MADVATIRSRLVLGLALTGVVVASVAGLSQHLEWLASLCTGFSEGCRQTADFSLFHLPLWLWGVGYYLLILLLFFGSYSLVLWALAVGFGIELGLVWIMFSQNIVCVFCLANFAVMLALVLCSLELPRLWQTVSVALVASILAAHIIPYQNGPQLGAASRREPAPAAKIGERTITYDELVLPVANRVFDLQEQIYRLERDRLDQLLAKLVIEREAEQQNRKAHELVKDYLAAQTITVQDGEIAAYYLENRARLGDWRGTEEELKAQIRAYLQQLKREQRLLEYARSLYPRHGVEIYLKEPQYPTIQVHLDQDDPVLGPENAPVTIVEFSDYQCPACRRSHELVRELRQSYGDRVRWVFKDFPMPGHQWARRAALAARCAAEQGKFWEYQDALFASQEELTPDRLTQLAGELNLQLEPFHQCLETDKFQPRLNKDLEQGRKLGFDTTPTFVINNRVVSGAPPAARFRQIINEELEKVRKNS